MIFELNNPDFVPGFFDDAQGIFDFFGLMRGSHSGTQARLSLRDGWGDHRQDEQILVMADLGQLVRSLVSAAQHRHDGRGGQHGVEPCAF